MRSKNKEGTSTSKKANINKKKIFKRMLKKTKYQEDPG